MFSRFQYEIIELLQKDTDAIYYFGLVPNNGGIGIDDALCNGVLFRFWCSSDYYSNYVEAEPSFFESCTETYPLGNTVPEERGET